MKTRYLIGEVAKIFNISPDILRHYDQIGLLKPNKRPNGYRYYDLRQFGLITTILKFRRLDFSLEDIKSSFLLEDTSSYIELIERQEQFLTTRIEELELLGNHISDIKEQFIHLRDHIDLFSIQSSPEFWIRLGPRSKWTDEINFTTMPPIFRSNNLTWTKLTRFGTLTYKDTLLTDGMDFSLGIFSTLPPDESDENTRHIPSTKTLYTVYRGPHDKIFICYHNALSWMKSHGYRLSGDIMERFIASYYTESDTDDYCAELWFPIKSNTESV